jgi:hypothetical protein
VMAEIVVNAGQSQSGPRAQNGRLTIRFLFA